MVENGFQMVALTYEKVIVCNGDKSIYEEFIGEDAMVKALHRFNQLTEHCISRL